MMLLRWVSDVPEIRFWSRRPFGAAFMPRRSGLQLSAIRWFGKGTAPSRRGAAVMETNSSWRFWSFLFRHSYPPSPSARAMLLRWISDVPENTRAGIASRR